MFKYSTFITQIMLVFLVVAICSVNLAQADSITNITTYYPNENWSSSFEWDLLKTVAPKYNNLLISPLGLKIMLSLLYQGSAGKTQRELESAIGFSDPLTALLDIKDIMQKLQNSENAEYLVTFGTRIFLDNTVFPKQTFARIAKDFYNTDIAVTNFNNTLEAAHSINSWAEKLTGGRIFTPVELEEAVMVIANAVYFKRSWKYPFSRLETFLGPFYIPIGHKFLTVSTAFMSTEDNFYIYESPKLDAKILRLPYEGERYSMFIVLPNSRGGLPSLIKLINLSTLKSTLFLLERKRVHVKIPKFKLDYQNRFVDALKELGLVEMFQNTANFSGLASENSAMLRKLVVSNIIQKCGIEVNEHGSGGKADSKLTSTSNTSGEATTTFEATHAFLFYIEEELSGQILFVGKVDNPLVGEPMPIPAKPKTSPVATKWPNPPAAARGPALKAVQKQT